MSFFQNSPWFIRHNKTTDAKLRLFCFPHSGGAASFFRPWKDDFPASLELISVQLPGREERSFEAFVTNVGVLAKQISDNLCMYRDATPFVFFGHSLGSLIAFEVVNELQKRSLSIPEYLIISGHNAPQFQNDKEIIHRLPDELFIKGMMKYQGMSYEVLENKELLAALLPRLRADFTLSETYKYEEKPRIECPILALGGKEDTTVPYSKLKAWENYTTKEFTINLFPGGHFFLNTYKEGVLATISTIIKNIIDDKRK